jgi:hypothetical protein
MAGEKHAGGRPSKYSPAYANECIEFMGQGFSLTAFAGEIGVSRETVYEWERSNPEFSDAIKKARAKRVTCLERQLLGSENGPSVTARIFALKNACPDEWREKQAVELTGKDGGPIETVDLSPLEAARRIAFALSKAERVKE